MGENLDVPGRVAVRTPMQWSAGPTGGFTEAGVRRLARRPPAGGYAPDHVNVADQRRDPDSLLAFIGLLVQRYRECPELGWSGVHVLEQPHASVLALCSSVDDAAMITLHNLAPEPVRVPLRVPVDGAERLVDVLADGGTDVREDGRAELDLDGYGYRWLRVVSPGTRRLV